MAWQSRWDDWLEKRIPAKSTRLLGHRDVFVFPSAWGFIFSILILLTLITGINYENAMVMAASFFMASLLVLHIVQSYKNLAGLRISFKSASPCFAGEVAVFDFEVHGAGRTRPGVEIGWLPSDYGRFHLSATEPARIHIARPTITRGLFTPGRLLITTGWPFGLVQAWTWQDLKADTWVYPRPVFATQRGSLQMQESEAADLARNRPDHDGADFVGLRQHIEGEPMTRIAWKKMAQTGQKLVREFSEQPVSPSWVDYHAYSGMPLETRLSLMCGHICSLAGQGAAFGMILPGLRLEPALSESHKHACLLALAQFRGVS